MADAVFGTFLVGLAVLAGAVLVMSIASGKAWDAIPWHAPVIVHRATHPRAYWAGIFASAVGFAVTAWIAIGFVFG
jgi:hypothetical protein